MTSKQPVEWARPRHERRIAERMQAKGMTQDEAEKYAHDHCERIGQRIIGWGPRG
jgi:hypothetical protein